MNTLAEILEEGTPRSWPSQLPNHLSASQLSQFLRCPEQYRRVRIQGERERPGAALIWGKADHQAHELNFRQKIASGVDIPVRDVEEAFVEAFDIAVSREDVNWGDDRPADLKDRGAALVGVYHRQVSPSIQPVAVEEKFSIQIAGCPVDVVGFKDLRGVVAQPTLDDPGAAPSRIIERKTSSRLVKDIKPEWRIQGALYQSVDHIPVDWHVSVKSGRPAVYTPTDTPGLHLPLDEFAVERTKRLVANTAAAIRMYFDTYGPDDPWPGATTHPWACHFCGFRPTCAWWVGR